MPSILSRPLAAILAVLLCGIFAYSADDPIVSHAESSVAIINLTELEAAAAEAIPAGPFGYVQGGAEDEFTLRANTFSFDSKQILPNGLAGIDGANLETVFLGIPLASPVIVAPMAAHGMVHADADKATIKGVHKAGSIMSISTYSSLPVEEIAASQPDAPIFFQLYATKDEGFNDYMVKKARDAGARAIILTIDAGTAGYREADLRNGYNYSSQTPNVMRYYEGKNMTQSEARALRKVSFTADDIRVIKQASGLPVLVKGILSPEAAETAIAAGADGIWVSNHGGRQMDGAPASFEMLPLIARVVDRRVPIVFDSGIRRGSHVFKALASGADIVAIGRPILYGLILGGSEGVHDVLQHLNKELTTTMILAGAKDIRAVKDSELYDPERKQSAAAGGDGRKGNTQ